MGFIEFYECLDLSDLPGIRNVMLRLKFLSHFPWPVIPLLPQFSKTLLCNFGFLLHMCSFVVNSGFCFVTSVTELGVLFPDLSFDHSFTLFDLVISFPGSLDRKMEFPLELYHVLYACAAIWICRTWAVYMMKR